MALLLETFSLEHLPADHTIHIALFQNVKNAAYLHQQLLSGNTDFEYAFIDASVILSRLHALAASYRAINDALAQRMKSRNVHSEIVFSLSPNNNIAESFRRFGVTATTQHLLVVKVSTPALPVAADDVRAHLERCVDGDPVRFDDAVLERMTDLPRVRKIYKLNSAPAALVQGVQGLKELEVLVLGSMALRGATN
ncbi:hypothetical protein PVAG01_02073 [Phlyctema vagabunda]|uniref:EKC/KEOPS complex subunit CGI121 n=1 Tax=Phlyctema vagabunda TaxID=108571 RepID=A0ABR4PPK4_9HELO